MAAQTSDFAGNLGVIVEQVAQEKGIDKAVLVETMEAAILKAAQAAFGPTRELEAQYNDETGSIDLFQYMRVVEHVEQPEREIWAKSSGSRSSGTRGTRRRRASRTRSSARSST